MLLPLITTSYLLLLLLSPIFSQLADPFGKAVFDCNRIHLSYCCASRIRNSCQQRCQSVECVNSAPNTGVFLGPRREVETFSRWLSNSGVLGTKHDGEALSKTPRRVEETTEPLVYTSTETLSPVTPFPTLIPLSLQNSGSKQPDSPHVFLVTASLPQEITTAKPDSSQSIMIPPPGSPNETLVALTASTSIEMPRRRTIVDGDAMLNIDPPKKTIMKPLEELSSILEAELPYENLKSYPSWSIRIAPHQSSSFTDGNVVVEPESKELKNVTASSLSLGFSFSFEKCSRGHTQNRAISRIE
ncbi:unnamed protein product [Enterobius vermicularis]|uniref:ShKT domain-containing protein n=1 Tax=Enterobius vermicularis TaxID=51028 RepID=A0A0N4VDI1_ENTVE|nr:unnamed protein product [Enterobius vermicularis]